MIISKSIFPLLVLLCGIQWVRAQSVDSLQLSVSTSSRPSFILTDPKEVILHEGELITVEGCIVSASLRSETNGKPLFINMFDPYPRNLFTVIIWGDDQEKFLSAAEYTQKLVRISGRLDKSKNPERPPSITLRHAKQITVLGDCPPSPKH